jgi:hypothetical protein
LVRRRLELGVTPNAGADSSKGEGESIIDAGTYHHVEVDGGDWTIDITAQ